MTETETVREEVGSPSTTNTGTTSDVAIVDTENCLAINSALPTSAVRHSIV